MKQQISRLELLLKKTQNEMPAIPQDVLVNKSTGKWSKMEILGHLIDSAINNLQRFTEIKFTEKPYTVRKYDQDGLVLANDYQHAALDELLGLWLKLNARIIRVIDSFTEQELTYAMEVNGNEVNLNLVVVDYVSHMEHHLDEIFNYKVL